MRDEVPREEMCRSLSFAKTVFGEWSKEEN